MMAKNKTIAEYKIDIERLRAVITKQAADMNVADHKLAVALAEHEAERLNLSESIDFYLEENATLVRIHKLHIGAIKLALFDLPWENEGNL